MLASWSLRARLTVVATALLGLGIVAGAALLAATVSRTLQEAVDSGALQSAREVAALVDTDVLPDPVPVGGEGTAAIQVVDAQGRVRAASGNTDRLVPVLRPDELARVRAGDRLHLDGDRLGLDGPLRTVGVPAGPPGDPQTVVVAVDYGGARSGVRLLVIGLAVGAPLLLAVVALATWEVAGRALAPVEELRRGAEAVTGDSAGSSGSRQLPLPAARDEVHRLAVTLNDMLARLDRAGARQRAFVSDAAHELRSPLASARTQLEVAARIDAGTPAGALAADVLVDVERLGRLVDDLLLLARLDEAPTTRWEPVDIGALAADVVGRYSTARVPVLLGAPATGGAGAAAGAGPDPVRGSAGTAVAADRDGDLVVRADPVALRRALVNLVDNAERYARARVSVDVASTADGVRLTVTDDGPGIPVADRERVFDRFTRVDSDRARGSGGAGLGLAIVRELVRAHGGTVTLEDAGPGLRAVVVLPDDRGDGERARDAVRRPPPSGGVSGAVGGSEPEG